MWKRGKIKEYGSTFEYCMKVYDTGSHWGINSGKISKLEIRRDGRIVCNYDRGWDVKPADPETQQVLDFLLSCHN